MSATFQKPNTSAVKAAAQEKLKQAQAAVAAQQAAAANSFTTTVEQLAVQTEQKVAGARQELIAGAVQAVQPVLKANDDIAELQRQLAAKKAERQAAKQQARQQIKSLSQEFNQVAKQAKQNYKASTAEAKAARVAVSGAAKAQLDAVKADASATVWEERKALLAYNYVMTQTAVKRPFNAAANIGKTVSQAVAAAAKVLVDAGKAGYNADPNVSVPEILLKRQKSNDNGPSTPAA